MKITSALLKNIGAIPIKETFEFNQQGQLMIRGKQVEVEQAIAIKEGAYALRNNNVRTLIREQMKGKALLQGIASQNLEQNIFARACLWVMIQEDELLDQFEQR